MRNCGFVLPAPFDPVVRIAVAIPGATAQIAAPPVGIAAGALASRADPRARALPAHDVLLAFLEAADLAAVLAPGARLSRAAMLLPVRERVLHVFAAPATAAADAARFQAGRVARPQRNRHVVVATRRTTPCAFLALGIGRALERDPVMGTPLVAAPTAARTGFPELACNVPVVPPDDAYQSAEYPL